MFRKLRHRIKILNRMNEFAACLPPKSSKKLLKLVYGQRWRESVWGDGKDLGDIDLVAGVLLTHCFAKSIEVAIPTDQREMALFALKTGNTADQIRNNVVGIWLNMRSLSGNEMLADTFLDHARGALMGMSEVERADYSAKESLNRLLPVE